MSDIVVWNKEDILSNTGVIEVPAMSRGVVSGAKGPPYPAYTVDFSVNAGSVTRTLVADNLLWQDGVFGPIRGLRFSNSMILTDITYPQVVSRTALVVGPVFQNDETMIDLTFDEGLVVRIEVDFNTGSLTATPRITVA